MNRSKIFLGATATLLAVAGVAATKAAKFGHLTICYFTQVQATGNVKIILTNQPCKISVDPLAPRCFYYTVGPLHTVTSFPLYTGVGPAPCTFPIKYDSN